MDPDFWRQTWRDNRIGFHRSGAHPGLVRHWAQLGLPASAAVLVPLCGKSLDLVWLRRQGHAVTGVELSRRALEQFVTENELKLSPTDRGFEGQGYHLLAGDWFTADVGSRHAAFYDRGALVAMPRDMRVAYVGRLLSSLQPGARGLLITFEYDQSAMDGPPFSVPADEVRRLFGGAGSIEEVGRTDVLEQEPGFAARGLERLDEVVWAIRGPEPAGEEVARS